MQSEPEPITECSFCGVSPFDDASIDYEYGYSGSRKGGASHGRKPAGAVSSSSGVKSLKPCPHRCLSAAYCTRKCQKAHYKDHKKTCQKLAGQADANQAKLEKEQIGYYENNMQRAYEDSEPRVVSNHSSFEYFNKPMVLHYDPQSCTDVPQCYLDQFMGVYLPDDVHNRFPLFKRDESSTLEFAKMILRVDVEMGSSHVRKERGMHLAAAPLNRICCLYMEDSWEVIDFHLNGPTLVAPQEPREKEVNLLSKLDSLFLHKDEAFSLWSVTRNGTTSKVKVAMTPADRFFETLSSMSSLKGDVNLDLIKDISFNMEIVLHANNSYPNAMQLVLDTLLGVYVQIKGQLFQGHPVWIWNEKQTLTMANHLEKEDTIVKQFLSSRGIGFNHEDTGFNRSSRACLYIFQGVFHVGSYEHFRTSPESDCYMKINSQGYGLFLSEPDALFIHGNNAFRPAYLLCQGSICNIKVAATPLPFFKNAIQLAKKEIDLLTADGLSLDVTPASTNRNELVNPSSSRQKKKKRKKKKKPVESNNDDDLNPIIAGIPDERITSEGGNEKQCTDSIASHVCADEKEQGTELIKLASPNKNDAKSGHRLGKNKHKVDEDMAKKNNPIQPVSHNVHEKVGGKEEDDRDICTSSTNVNEEDETMIDAEAATQFCKFCKMNILTSGFLPGTSFELSLNNAIIDDNVRKFFNVNAKNPIWFLVSDSLTAPLLKDILASTGTILQSETLDWFRSISSDMLLLVCQKGRKHDMVELMQAQTSISAKILCKMFDKLPNGRKNEIGNKLVYSIRKILLESKADFGSVIKSSSKKIGKNARKSLLSALKDGETQMAESWLTGKANSSHQQGNDLTTPTAKINEEREMPSISISHAQTKEDNASKVRIMDECSDRINKSITFYTKMLEEYMKENKALSHERGITVDTAEDQDENRTREDINMLPSPVRVLSSEEIASEMARCVKLPRQEQEEIISSIEMGFDLSTWDEESEWTIDITELAHKWFRKRSKRSHHLCERVIRRLKLLSTGRWPYVLCKPLKTRSASIKLYESKIDSASRIIWEVAVSFSPRRSSEQNSYCEQVIRVWDIVEDHDNLTRAINRAVDRIEKSHLRGQKCMLYSELDGFDGSVENESTSDKNGMIFVPRVFTMKQNIKCQAENENLQSEPKLLPRKGAHYPPANDDERQFNLLKFYELDSGAIKLILEAKNENMDLPFTPGPKEHEIIHYKSNPRRSILLMGRSGTGKTTCLVFRMWAQFMAYSQSSQTAQPRQIFVTKNDVLRNEVEKSFNNMGLAWQRRSDPNQKSGSDNQHIVEPYNTEEVPNKHGWTKFPLFLTSSEWLEILDTELPEKSFFTPTEVEKRSDNRKEDDDVHRGMEEFFAGDNKSNDDGKLTNREEMTYDAFRKLWCKINSRTKTTLDPALVWLEIKSHIKGSVAALCIGVESNSQQKDVTRFLSRDNYLALPRKQSRLNESQRQVVYDLYVWYEKLKKDANMYDEMDLVHHLAGRLKYFYELDQSAQTRKEGLLPVNTVFVDEVQDFTQAELYLLTQLCSDPNNLMLAGDTAQSIAVGVGFRFTDVRQIFYHSFGGTEPHLLHLTHNYRSHAGILRLAACVVELLYFFFSESLDKLPPDLGLFPGPKPVLMEVTSVADLVLMLDGSKRETSRIEFGAHQVVIVRNEEAKKSLPDEFGVDRDWVMTVQQSKGLEFDDVLLYNFFTDSEAGELWRVVSNYSHENIQDYYADSTVSSSGVQSFEWDDVNLVNTRNLDFSSEEHKILETELKMLYTAITRARVNVFIAETDGNISRPMFNYFKKRHVVEVVAESSNRDGLSGVRVFGKLSTLDDWKNRGEYYLQNAEGQRRNGCLRLAAKCFDRAGLVKRRDHALAYLSFVQIEEQDSHSIKRRTKYGLEQRQQLYDIAAQLLEAEDAGFLNKAGLCLVKTGASEYARSAKMFEIYARICYTKRQNTLQNDDSPSKHEQSYFSYAGKLFLRHLLQKQIEPRERQSSILNAFRCFACSGSTSDLKHASDMLEANIVHCQQIFVELHSLCQIAPAAVCDPISSFQAKVRNNITDVHQIIFSLTKLARIASRSFHANNDPRFTKAMGAIPSREERIQVLSDLDSDIDTLLGSTLWGASHICFSGAVDKNKRGIASRKKVNVTAMLVQEFLADGKRKEASEIFENRGLLLEAAGCLSEGLEASVSSPQRVNSKINRLRAQYVELVLESSKWKKEKDNITVILQALTASINEGNGSISNDVKISTAMSYAKLSGNEADLLRVYDLCANSTMWKCAGTMMAIKALGLERFLQTQTSTTIWLQASFLISVARLMTRVATVLRRSVAHQNTAADIKLIAQVESYFYLESYQFDPSFLSTKVITNLRLREAFQSAGENHPVSVNATSSKALTVPVDREKTYKIIAVYMDKMAWSLLSKLEKYLSQKSTETKPCPFIRCGTKCKYGYQCKHNHSPDLNGMQEYVTTLQSHLFCLSSMQKLRKQKSTKAMEKSQKAASDKIVHYLFQRTEFSIELQKENVVVEYQPSVIVLREPVLEVLSRYAGQKWNALTLSEKKRDAIQTIRLWKTFHLSEGKNASRLVEERLSKIEKHKSTSKDRSSKNIAHFMPNDTETIPAGKLKSTKLFTRFWIYAVDSAKENLIDSISIVERLLEMTTHQRELTTLSSNSQIEMLEVSAVGLFTLLSLRYNAIDSSKLFWLAIPERSYLNSIFLGKGFNRGRGFGVPIKDCLTETSHKHFFDFFAEFVLHLNRIASLIVTNKLLVKPSTESEPEVIEAFERAIILSCFILCNAVAVSRVGTDMSPEEVKNDQTPLPRLPLNGYIRDLVKTLRDVILQCNSSTRLRESFYTLSDNSSILDVFRGTSLVLEKSRGDPLVLCRVYQAPDKTIDVVTHQGMEDFELLIADVPFHDGRGAFVEVLTKGQQFLVEQQGNINLDKGAMSAADLKALSRQSDERNAAIVITRSLRYWQTKPSHKTSSDSFFQKWKKSLSLFQHLMKKRLEEKARNRVSKVTVSSVGMIHNIWSDLGKYHTKKQKWKAMLMNELPLEIDGVECQFCGFCFDTGIMEMRQNYWRQFHPDRPYRLSVRDWKNSGNEPAPSDYAIFMSNDHLDSQIHSERYQGYTVHMERLSNLLARLESSDIMLQSMVEVCKLQEEQHHTTSSWYMVTGDEARSLLNTTERARQELITLRWFWPLPPRVSCVIDAVDRESLQPQAFYNEKRQKEEVLLSKVQEEIEDQVAGVEHDPLVMLGDI